jgi:hypothetical protein
MLSKNKRIDSSVSTNRWESASEYEIVTYTGKRQLQILVTFLQNHNPGKFQPSDFVKFCAVTRPQSRFVTICDKIGISDVHVFCAKSVGLTNYYLIGYIEVFACGNEFYSIATVLQGEVNP